MGRRRGRSPRVKRAVVVDHHGHNAPFINSPRAPPQALGAPPKALTPCWHPFPRNYYNSIANSVSASQDLKNRMKAAHQFQPNAGENINFKMKARNHTHDQNENAKDFKAFLLSSNMPIKRLLPRLRNLERDKVIKRISDTRMFPHLMERFQAKALGSKMSSGRAARALIDPSAHAWGDKSPRFVRTRGKNLQLSTLTYRASPLATFGADRDTFYCS